MTGLHTGPVVDPSVFIRRITGVETEYGLTAMSQGHRVLSPPALARYLFRPVIARYGSQDAYTTNAARLYVDVGDHPEYATPECDSLSQLLAQERAGDEIINSLARTCEQSLEEDGLNADVYLFKNNVDSVGNSYGCHENYLVSRHIVLKSLGLKLVPFLITRQLMCGSGMITRAEAGKGIPEFLISQRADQVWESVSSASTRSRPMINTRDEPHADSHRFRRLHVIVGDSNIAEPTLALKVGSMQLMLEMLEHDPDATNLPEFDLVDPVRQIRAISSDPTGSTPLELTGGGYTTAVEIQQRYAQAAKTWLQERDDSHGGTPNEEMARVIDLWERTLAAVESGDFSGVDTEIDWVIKKKLLDRFARRLDCDYAHPKIAQVALAYHDIRPGRGLYRTLVSRGDISRWISDDAIADAVNHPPSTTRAHDRGRFVSAAASMECPVTANWASLKVNRPEPQEISLDDPFIHHDERVDELIEYMAAHTTGGVDHG